MNEDQNIEYKQSWRDEYLKWICGFANATGGLWVVMKRKVFGEVTPPQVSVPVSVPVSAPVIMEILNSKEYVNSFIYLFSEKQECSSREILEAWGLLSLRYVRLNYITPLLKAGILRLKYPDNPNHPQQRYLLNEIK